MPCKFTQLDLNASKNKLKLFTIFSATSTHICIDSDIIEFVEHFKNLEVVIDKNLKYNVQVNQVCNKTHRQIAIAHYIREYLDYKTQKPCIFLVFFLNVLQY